MRIIKIETSKALYCRKAEGNTELMIAKFGNLVFTLDYYNNEVFKSIFKVQIETATLPLYKEPLHKKRFALEIKGKLFVKEI